MCARYLKDTHSLVAKANGRKIKSPAIPKNNEAFWKRAEDGTRTRDPNLGKVMLYQLDVYKRQGIYNHKSITKARTAGEKTGFSGVLVVCGIDNYGNATYYAFDLCCPHEAKKNIIIEADNAGKAICPECGTEYDIGYGTGAPTKGVSQFPLRKYYMTPVSSDRQEWVVRN